jgi:hypothetical protein
MNRPKEEEDGQEWNSEMELLMNAIPHDDYYEANGYYFSGPI